ncbi:hypothetical protein BEUL_1011 [Bifidobacterium eulemuris]|uniref:Uncharacterized protein n=2 Tax=Bifidobacterium eulemuris TaxID=1765219 RepID=A0A261GB91_9BIFI|nr:hypothetical protein BEUL_1011 [Bifidobacterium eulemuris]
MPLGFNHIILIQALIWIVSLVVIWVFPSVLSIYGVLWIVLPCQLCYIGFRSGKSRRGVCANLMTVLLSGISSLIATMIIGTSLNMLYGWNLYFSPLDYLILGFVFSSGGVLLSIATQWIKTHLPRG